MSSLHHSKLFPGNKTTTELSLVAFPSHSHRQFNFNLLITGQPSQSRLSSPRLPLSSHTTSTMATQRAINRVRIMSILTLHFAPRLGIRHITSLNTLGPFVGGNVTGTQLVGLLRSATDACYQGPCYPNTPSHLPTYQGMLAVSSGFHPTLSSYREHGFS